MIHLALHGVERIAVEPVKEMEGSRGPFALRNIVVTYRDSAGVERSQRIDLYATEAAKLAVRTQEHDMVAALSEAREYIAADRAALLETHTNTASRELELLDEKMVADIDALLGRIDAALTGTAGEGDAA